MPLSSSRSHLFHQAIASPWKSVRGFGQATFLVYEDERVSYEAFHRAVATFAEALALDGVGTGDRVAIVMRNLPEWPVAFYATLSLGAIATGAGSNLLVRAALVTMKERRPLILCHRETPLNLIDIDNMRHLTLAGAIICPTNPGFYLKPQSVQDIVDFVVGKVLDLLKVEHELVKRWE
jgi:hypothetical protein